MAFATFGVITPILSVVISVFMLGLGLGSWLGGEYIERLSDATGQQPILFYGLAEFFIGVGGIVIPLIFSAAQALLLRAGNLDSSRYLLLSAVLLGISLFPFCLFMGTTFPFVASFIKRFDKPQKTSFSYLYLANVLGAMTGVIAAAYFLIEWNKDRTLGELYGIMLRREIPLKAIVLPYFKFSITDDRPFNEYFYVRDLLRAWAVQTGGLVIKQN
ncbi:MAG: hypothetical protein V1923_01665 [Candidatus Omnitrophota bacterium]